ncbi:hypothetical protein FQN50_003106 [Emmonsiellopsis sp. PD_5]|nr:hypothetical protein FQN50_003106 [Emmonsiellopsis sp. PD_5]
MKRNRLDVRRAGYTIVAGRPFTLFWEPGTEGKVTVAIFQNPPVAGDHGSIIGGDVPNSGVYTFVPTTDSAWPGQYTIKITDNRTGLSNITPPFTVKQSGPPSSSSEVTGSSLAATPSSSATEIPSTAGLEESDGAEGTALSGGAKIGIGVGIPLATIFVICLIFIYRRWKKGHTLKWKGTNRDQIAIPEKFQKSKDPESCNPAHGQHTPWEAGFRAVDGDESGLSNNSTTQPIISSNEELSASETPGGNIAAPQNPNINTNRSTSSNGTNPPHPPVSTLETFDENLPEVLVPQINGDPEHDAELQRLRAEHEKAANAVDDLRRLHELETRLLAAQQEKEMIAERIRQREVFLSNRNR